MEQVYPKLRQFCQKKGYEFQVVDMRWGVRDDATDTHMTTQLCLREIKACQEISVGPNFVTLLSEKYGYRPLMPSITAKEFELILSKASDNQIHELLIKWYKEDENCFPVSYILQPVTTWIPNFINDSCDLSLREQAQKQWESEYNMMREFLLQAAKEVLNEEDIWQKYVTSVSEEEIKRGLLEVGNPKRSCVWFHRTINGLDSDADNPEVLKYTDNCPDGICLADGTHPQALLHNLKNEKMKQAMDTENIFTYDVTWTPNGIDPSLDEHKKYLDQFCKDFEDKIKDMISEGISEHKVAETDNLLYSEVVQHTLFCKRKLEVVYGRKSTVEEIEDYVRGPSRYPLVIHGKSGCGKTAVIAMAAKSISELLDQKGCICLRFLGTTPKSSTILRVLKSVMLQIKHVYKLTTKVPRSSKGVFDQFPSFLSSATKDNPLVVILDSLDQLSPLHGAWKLTWFPRKLPLHVKFIVSTLPDQEYKCFPVLKALFKNPKCFVSVPELSSDDVSDILTNWLKSENRTLQGHQLQVLKDAFKMCPLPLFLKISYDETRLWRSYSAVSETCLETTIRKAIDKLLERVEISHGEVLVRRALGYLTAASLGLATNELEDILSCDEDLLHDVFQYWTPPIRRLPPLLWVRIRADLSSYLVDRGADGTQVTCWYHRQFVQAAEDRYLSDAVEKKRLHTHIADYFLGRNFVEEDTKEMTVINGKQVRLASISGQPLLLSKGRYNLRKLHELPIQLIRSQRWGELKSEVLCNFEWLSTKIEVRTLRSVLDNFRSAMNAVNDSDIAAVAETLQLAQDAILSDPNQLAAQFVGRLYECKVQDPFHVVPTNLSPVLAKLVKDSRNPPEPALIPSRGFLTPPGGQLVHTLVVNSASVVYGLAATSNGKFVVTGSQEGVVKVWDNSDGSLVLTVPEAGEEIGTIACGCDDDVIIVSSKTGISLISFETGEILQRVEIKFFEGCPPFTLAGEKGSKVVFLKEKGLHVISASGKFLHQFSGINPVGGAGQNSLLTSWNDTVLCNSKEDENSLKVIDTSDYKILHAIKVFTEKDEEEFLHLTQVTMKSESEVLVAKKMKIDLYSVDSGEHLRTYKCKVDDWIRNLSLDPDEGMLMFPKENKVALLDLESGERKDVLPHPNFVSRVFAVGSDVILTSGGDNVVRVWDLTREDVHRQVQKPETVLNIYSIPGDPRHLVTLGRLGIDNYCVTIWDLATMLPLRKITGITTSYLQIINDRRAAIRVKENVAIVDLHTWKVVNVLKGKIPPYDLLGVDDICVVNDNTEILTYSHDRKNLMLYDIETGDQVAMLKSGQPQQDIRSFLVNSEGTIVAWNEAKPTDQVHVWDLETREQIFIIKREGCERQSMTHAGFTPDGDYFVSSTKEGKKGSPVKFLAVWDMRKKELLHDLRYSNDTDTISVTILDNTRAITAHKDLNIVCWDIEEGTPIHILPSNHFSNLRINIIASKGDVVVSYDEKTLIMWDMRAGAQKATFTADKVTAIHPVGEGQCIALGYESVLPLVLLTLQGGDVKPYEFPTEGTKAIAGTDMQIEFEGIKGEIVEEEEDTKVSDGENETVKQREKKEEHGSDCVTDRLIEN
ncbi:NACHT domain- and WD repeat-containing protein 1-like isoform X3 [Stylophora pistillata]|nr:NACHT domain- and WD repeat-containing protein 1-like isoform X3 [Stylophora pistillata]